MEFNIEMKGVVVPVLNETRLTKDQVEKAVADCMAGAKPFGLGIPSKLHLVNREASVMAYGWCNLGTKVVVVTVGEQTTEAGFSHTLGHELRHLEQGKYGYTSHIARENDARKVGLRIRRFVKNQEVESCA